MDFQVSAIAFNPKKDWLPQRIKFALIGTDETDIAPSSFAWKRSASPAEIEAKKPGVVKAALALAGLQDDARYKNAQLVSVDFAKGDPELFEIKIQGDVDEYERYTETVYRAYGSISASQSAAINALRSVVESLIGRHFGI